MFDGRRQQLAGEVVVAVRYRGAHFAGGGAVQLRRPPGTRARFTGGLAELHGQQAVPDQPVEMEGRRTPWQPQGQRCVFPPDRGVRVRDELIELPALLIAQRSNRRHAAAPGKSAHSMPFLKTDTHCWILQAILK